jgi:thiamine-monophosphate kinase
MTSSSSDRPGEFELIRELFAPLSKSAPGAFGLTDDAALISVSSDEELVVTVDALIEGVHFLPDDPPHTIAKKSLRVNLSDLAAKGAEPKAYLLALALPERPDRQWLRAFARGLAEDQKEFRVSLIGGDTTRTPGPLTIAITAFGAVPCGTMIRRKGAKSGDLVFVSGTIGDAGMGLDFAEVDTSRDLTIEAEALIERYRCPTPRVRLGLALRGLASAALDVSDGLIADLDHIAEVSAVRIEVDADRIPISRALMDIGGDSVELRTDAATSGDDYEIAFTAPPAKRDEILSVARKTKTQVTEIGRVMKGAGAVLLNEDGHEIPLAKKGFTHF